MNENIQHTDGLLEHPQCARCGYDLTGEVESWKESCPVAGVCSECGLEFEWADALRVNRQALRWQFEHAKRWWNIRKAWGTAIRALFPWQFWKSVQPHHEIRGRRLAVWLLVCVGSVWLISGAIGFGIITFGTIGLGHPRPFIFARSVPIVNVGSPNNGGQGIVMMCTPPPPPARMIGPRTVHVQVKNKWATFALPRRGEEVVYRDTPIGTVVFRRFEVKRAGDATPMLNKYAGSIEDAAMVVQFVDETDRYNPDNIMSYVWPWTRMFYSKHKWPTYGYFQPPYELFVTLAFLIPALAVVLAAPTEWRRAKVRRVHLWRITTYSFALAIFPVALEMLVYAWAHVGWLAKRLGLPGFGGTTFAWAPPGELRRWTSGQFFAGGVTVYVTVWLAAYWWFALKRGLRLKRPFWLWFFVCLAGAAGTLNLYVARQALLLEFFFREHIPYLW